MAQRWFAAVRPRVILSAVVLAAGLLALTIGRVLVQAHSAPPAHHHAAVTISRPASSAGGQITRNADSAKDANDQEDDADEVNDDHQGDADTDTDGD
jgi:hypothetical protein